MADSLRERELENAAELKVQGWRRNELETSALKKELLSLITEKTFHSAKLLRLYTEVLICNSEQEEAYAAFDTYVSLQCLSLIKATSGARSLPDSLTKGTVSIFTLMLTTLESLGDYGEERIFKLNTQLSEVMKNSNEEDYEDISRAFAPIFARIAVTKMLTAINDEQFKKYSAEASSWFEKVADSSDSNVNYYKALMLAVTEGPAAAFPAAKAAVTNSADHVRGALLLIQLLSAEQQFDSALELANAYLSRSLTPKSIVDKAALINLKKSQIALMESRKGLEVALSEITEFIGLINTLFTVNDSNGNGNANGYANGSHPREFSTSKRIFSFKRKPTAESIVSATSTPSEALTSSRAIAANDSRVISFGWFWVAQQYAKAGLEAQAREALEEGKSFLLPENDLDGQTQLQAIIGQIEHQSNPQRALKHYMHALSLQPLHVSSAIGAVLLLTSETNIESQQRYDETLLSLSGNLEAICQRTPGRFIPEAWYARGLLYDKLGIPEEARKMYWKTVELEERRGITTYVNSVLLPMC